ncbi:putative nucleotide phosphoribosyltransferase [Campylobacter blaseri]|uniref:Nicotinate phosphoribosyltransferase n=1 Tax=Campylobacter blaseri TaxID=2042961 RepID=A0A2P8QYL8_9BACT|nr:phosphoribosyltransferase family protein [Campylobacter blaseri]PSM51339.1 nicotinate phosphoribosyltransferase [Campylobacter blaseri]PSM52483.1 nicotinate phosphoribosyltransferase [Campylobacter blaseri]QKF86186.1 putative nucleotide phosphoribosyltransferase [Campylobacter blaseri]
MKNYSYEEFKKDIKKLGKMANDDFKPQAFLAIARGGMTMGHFLANGLKNRNLFSLNSIHYDDTKKLNTVEVFNIPNLDKFNRVLLVDDIIDSGESMVEILRILKERFPKVEFKIATLFYKDRALVTPEYFIKKADDWIVFFWDIEI